MTVLRYILKTEEKISSVGIRADKCVLRSKSV